MEFEVLVFLCRYQMPLALVGLLASLALWELFKYCSDRWEFDRHPSARKLVIGIGQCGEFLRNGLCPAFVALQLESQNAENVLICVHRETFYRFLGSFWIKSFPRFTCLALITRAWCYVLKVGSNVILYGYSKNVLGSWRSWNFFKIDYVCCRMRLISFFFYVSYLQRLRYFWRFWMSKWLFSLLLRSVIQVTKLADGSKFDLATLYMARQLWL